MKVIVLFAVVIGAFATSIFVEDMTAKLMVLIALGSVLRLTFQDIFDTKSN